MSRQVVYRLGVILSLAAGGTAAAELRPFTLDDAMAVRRVSDPQVSPDGRHVLYAVSQADAASQGDRGDLWIVETTGGEARQFTHSAANDRSPRWSPDGRQIAFLSDRDGVDETGGRVSRRAQVWAMPVDGGEPRQVTRAPRPVIGFEWSPDGKRLAYVAEALPADNDQREARRKDGFDEIVAAQYRFHHLFAIAAGGGPPMQLTSGDFDVSEIQWAPDGASIVFVSRPTPVANEQLLSDLFVVSSTGGAPRPLVQHEGADHSPTWSPDGRHLAYLSNPRRQSSGGHNRVMVVDADGGSARSLTGDFELSAGAPRWSRDGATLYFVAEQGTESHVFSVPTSGGAVTRVTSGTFVHGSLDLSRDGRRMAFLREDPRTPPDVWMSAVDGSSPIRLTTANPQLDGIALARTEVMTWKGTDGWTIEGILVTPAGFQAGRRYPLIVEAHGGPHGRMSVGLNPMWQYFAAGGYAVLAPNFRGSSGYSQAFVDADRNDWGGKDYEDVMRGIEHVVAAGIADPDRVGIEGWSYGGFMTAWAIGQTGRFKAAVVGAGVTNLQSFYGTTDIQRFIEWEYHGFPWDNVEAIRTRSPITYAHRVKTPTLILHGQDDQRVPIEQGQQLYTTIRKVGTTVDFVTYPREGHGLREPAHRRDRMERTRGWFDRFLK